MIATPPPYAERLLAITIRNQEWRACIVGDLREEFASIAERHGIAHARRWYWRQTFAIGSRTVTARLGSRRALRAWVAPPELEPRAGWFVGLSRDLRHAWRTLARRPATSIVIVATLALALAANSTVFSLLDALVLRAYRLPGLDRIVMVASSSPSAPFIDRESVAPADFREWRSQVRSIEHLAAVEWWEANLSGIEEPEHVPGFKVSPAYFDALGVRAVVGRTFTPDEETLGKHRRVIIGHALWTRRFAADPAIVGQTIRLDGEPHEVVGVAPADFMIPFGAQVWAPLAYDDETWNERRASYLLVFGRLRDGVTRAAAFDEVRAIVQRQREANPETHAQREVNVVSFVEGMSDPGSAPIIGIAQAAGVLLLLIACANIGNLLLARGAERTHEFGVRLALGAGRGRLAWQTVLEGAMLAAAAVAIAMPLAWVGLGLSRAGIPVAVIRFIPGWSYLSITPLVFVLTAGLGVIATLAFSLLPALQASRLVVAETLRHGTRTLTNSRRRQWGRSVLATSQVALTLALLFASGLMLSAASRAVNGTLGFDKRDVLTANVILPERQYAAPERRRQFIDGVVGRLRTIPAVTNVAMTSHLPYGGSNNSREFWPEGVELTPADVRSVDSRRVSPEYFSALRIPLLAGRGFTEADRDDAPAVAIVSRSLAARYWNDQDPLGRRFRFNRDSDWITVIGVSDDILHDWFMEQRNPTVYRPAAQDAPFVVSFVIRTVGDPMSVASDLRRAVAAVDPDLPVVNLRSLEQVVADKSSGLTFIARTLGAIAMLALLLAVTGLYSLMSFLASRRTQEIGVRMALGAGHWHVVRLATSHALWITTAGVVFGSALALGLARLMQSVLRGMVPAQSSHLPIIIVVLALVAMIAAYLPARRAAALDPTSALRAD
jgi:putative ABC transport system permease protein